jgi:kynurenine formamidase
MARLIDLTHPLADGQESYPGDPQPSITARDTIETIDSEALANLDRCPEEFIFVGLPLLLTGRDGSPIRAAAIVD